MEYILGKKVLVVDSDFGKNTTIGDDSRIYYSKIGKYCSVSWNVNIGIPSHTLDTITTHNFIHSSFYGFIEGCHTQKKITEIGHDVWIGVNSVILAGVKIGNGAVIGAGSIVSKDVEAYAIYAGNPAKLIRYRFDKKTIAILEDLKWWNFDEKLIKKFIHLFSLALNDNNLKELIKLKKDSN